MANYGKKYKSYRIGDIIKIKSLDDTIEELKTLDDDIDEYISQEEDGTINLDYVNERFYGRDYTITRISYSSCDGGHIEQMQRPGADFHYALVRYYVDAVDDDGDAIDFYRYAIQDKPDNSGEVGDIQPESFGDFLW